MLDPISALGVAAAAAQFLDFGSSLISRTTQVSRSADGAVIKNSHLESTTKHLLKLSSELDNSLKRVPKAADLTSSELENQKLYEECQSIATELLAALKELKVTGKRTTWKSFRQAFISLWNQQQIDALEGRLEDLRQKIVLSILITIRDQVDLSNQRQLTAIERGSELAECFLDFVDENRRWRADLVNAIWQSHTTTAVRFFTTPNQAISAKDPDGLTNRFVNRLRFSSMQDRHFQIANAHQKTFEWIYRDPQSGRKSWSSYVDWLETGSNVYWITGKAGSGKSTLMKHLYEDTRTYDRLHLWADGLDLVTAAFFFWSPGNTMQHSQTGLLQSLLYQIVKANPALIPSLFPERWEAYSLLGDDSHPWTWSEFIKAIKALKYRELSSAKYCFFIDGLDEFDGDAMDLISLFEELVSEPHIKLCVSSRPWVVFEDAFRFKPSLMLQDLTYDDIKLYVTEKFQGHSGFGELEKRDITFAKQLVDDVATKASGVFLWVYLVVGSLLAGFRNGDRISDLRKRLDMLPPDLEHLFQNIMDSIDPFYIEHASQLFQIVGAAVESPTLLLLSLTDDDDASSLLSAHIKHFTDDEVKSRAATMKRRLNSRCMGLLEVNHHTEGEISSTASDAHATVQYLHRTVKDFFDGQVVRNWLHAATKSSFDPYISLCRGLVLDYKFNSLAQTHSSAWDVAAFCVFYANKAPSASEEALVSTFDELTRVIRFTKAGNIPAPFEDSKQFGKLLGRTEDCERYATTLVSSTCFYGGATFYLQADLDDEQRRADRGRRLVSDTVHFALSGLQVLLVSEIRLLRSIAEDSSLATHGFMIRRNYHFPSVVEFMEVLIQHGADPNWAWHSIVQELSSSILPGDDELWHRLINMKQLLVRYGAKWSQAEDKALKELVSRADPEDKLGIDKLQETMVRSQVSLKNPDSIADRSSSSQAAKRKFARLKRITRIFARPNG